ncbi:hypothetical protein AMECASPLE_024472, partial [Ameca splendens]
QRDISTLVSPASLAAESRVEEIGLMERRALIQTVASWELCCYSLLGCARSRLMQFILKVPEKFV